MNTIDVEKILLKGYSGCCIYKCYEDEKVIVKKISKDINYNNRFLVQLEKQEWFNNLYYTEQTKCKAPQVYTKFLNNNNLIECNMEYIDGISIVDYVNSEKEILNSTYLKIITYFKIIPTIEAFEKVNDTFSNILNKKVDNILKTDIISIELKEEFIKATNKIAKLKINPTFCHGDFTLENMIFVNDGTMYLIDFLDSFYPHFWLDISKLYQEIEAGWQFIKNDIDEPSEFENNFLKKKCDEYFSKVFPDYSECHYYFLALTLARIIPYANDKNILNRLILKVKKYIYKYNSNIKLGE